MFYVYVLDSNKDGKLYIGRTDDLRRRLNEHNLGKVASTRHRRPFKLCFYESFIDKRDSIRRERYFKTSKGRSSLGQIIRYSIDS
ncbi:MAG: GIY-YIG nuclease family protein [Candidatus Uhrbacteria bacterium]|nr:GIY-YIG nuclease family protein [Candidatus Uhrbacteria bacterium]